MLLAAQAPILPPPDADAYLARSLTLFIQEIRVAPKPMHGLLYLGDFVEARMDLVCGCSASLTAVA